MYKDNIANLRQNYFSAIMKLTDEKDILDAMPQPLYESFFPIAYGLMDMFEQRLAELNEELITSFNAKEYSELITEEIQILNYKKSICQQLILQAEDIKNTEMQAEMVPKKSLIFATTQSGNIYLERDLKDIPEEYLDSIAESLTCLENGFAENNNKKGKELSDNLSGLHEIKQFKVRIYYKNITPDTVFIILAKMKKSNNDLSDRNKPLDRSQKTQSELLRLKEQMKDPTKKEIIIKQNQEIRDRIMKYINENRRGKNGGK